MLKTVHIKTTNASVCLWLPLVTHSPPWARVLLKSTEGIAINSYQIHEALTQSFSLQTVRSHQAHAFIPDLRYVWHSCPLWESPLTYSFVSTLGRVDKLYRSLGNIPFSLHSLKQRGQWGLIHTAGQIEIVSEIWLFIFGRLLVMVRPPWLPWQYSWSGNSQPINLILLLRC